MAPPVFQPGRVVQTRDEVDARVCTRRGGYRNVELPPGRYRVTQCHRDMDHWHDQEYSDGYTYRLAALDADSSLRGKRISIWQNDLADACWP